MSVSYVNDISQRNASRKSGLNWARSFPNENIFHHMKTILNSTWQYFTLNIWTKKDIGGAIYQMRQHILSVWKITLYTKLHPVVWFKFGESDITVHYS